MVAAATAEPVTVNVAVLLPAATLTEAGVVKEVLLSANVTSAPPVGAAVVKVTVQVDVTAPVSDARLQLREDTSKEVGMVTTPPLAEVATAMAVGETEDAFVTWTGRLRLELDERVKIPVATMPLDKAFRLGPVNRQV